MKDNLMVRLLTFFVLLGILLAHFSGQTNLFSANWLWLAVLPAVMGLQATFTGFCPAELIGKLSKSGECCPNGSCGTPKTDASAQQSNRCCESSQTPNHSANNSSSCCGDKQAMQIKVLGTGCANCNNTAKLIETTAQELNINVQVNKEEDIANIASYGVMSTPGVVVNEVVVHSGGIPTKKAITEWLKNHSN